MIFIQNFNKTNHDLRKDYKSNKAKNENWEQLGQRHMEY